MQLLDVQAKRTELQKTQVERERALLGALTSLSGCENVPSVESGVDKLVAEIKQLRSAGLTASETSKQLAQLQTENAKLLAAIEAGRAVESQMRNLADESIQAVRELEAKCAEFKQSLVAMQRESDLKLEQANAETRASKAQIQTEQETNAELRKAIANTAEKAVEFRTQIEQLHKQAIDKLHGESEAQLRDAHAHAQKEEAEHQLRDRQSELE